ncbi:MAG: hypothetical protein ACYTBJ_26980 [Planctomycetota bacterium]|jgi:hypothetical protein
MMHLYSVDIGCNDNDREQRLIFDAESPFHALCIVWSYYPDRQIDYIGRGINSRCFCDTPAKDYADVWGYFPSPENWEVLYYRYDCCNNDLMQLVKDE